MHNYILYAIVFVMLFIIGYVTKYIVDAYPRNVENFDQTVTLTESDTDDYRERLDSVLESVIGKYDIIYNTKSDVQNIEIIKFKPNNQGYDKCLLLDNEPQLCTNDETEYHEIIVHLPSAYFKRVETVLIIGGGDCMTLREVMKYPSIKQVCMIELDASVIDASKRFFNVDTFDDDPRVNIVIGDASVKIQDVVDAHYDIVIVDTTEDGDSNRPIDSIDFFRACKSKLKPGGILVKNGEQASNIVSIGNLFKYIDMFDLASISIYGEYHFIIASDHIEFKKAPLINIDMNKNRVATSKYNKSNHYHYFIGA